MDIDLLSLFPAYFESPLSQSLIHKAIEKGIVNIRQVDIRDFALDKHTRVDDRPFGGGPGMILKPEPLTRAIRSVKRANSHVVYLSPQGKTLNAAKSEELSAHEHLILVCGHYEGIDERVIELEIDEEISIGDYVLLGGGVAALVLIEAVIRRIPGVIGDDRAVKEDSFEGDGLLDTSHYTRPRVFEEREVPEVLLSGDHKKIEEWRRKEKIKKTLNVRPDLFLHSLSKTKEGEKGSDSQMQIVLCVEDVDKSARFFYNVLSWEVSHSESNEAVVKCGNNRVILKQGEKEMNKQHVLFKVSIADRIHFDRCVTGLRKCGKVLGKIEKVLSGEVPSDQIAFRDVDGYQWVLTWNPSYCNNLK